MAFTYTAGGDDRSMVRLLIPDTNPEGVLFQDAELDAFLALENGDVRYAAAAALEAIARNQSLLLRSINMLDIQVNPQAQSAELYEGAKRLRCLSDEDAAFDIAEVITSPEMWRRRLWNQRLRGIV